MDQDAREDDRGAVVALAKNTPPTFYRGAGRIDAFRGTTHGTDRPEDWVASTVTRFGDEAAGLTVLAGGRLLRDEVRADPTSWLGSSAHAAPELEVPLVKLLDAGQRLPVHVHPDDSQARALGVGPQGKAEAWCVLEAPPGAQVHLGWTRDVAADELARWVRDQDVDAMLSTMHAVGVAPGDTVYVPPGAAHAIGRGIFLVEVQQAADLSVLLEWADFFADSSGAFLGLAPDDALGCTDLRALADVEALVGRGALERPAGAALLPAAADAFFSATVVGPGSVLPAQYRTLVVLSGTGRLVPASARPSTELTRGGTFAAPAHAGPLAVEGSADLRVLAFGPPSVRQV